MSRILVIGSSHAGAVKLAWDETKDDHTGVELDFLVLPWPHFAQLRLYDDMTYGARAPFADEVARANALMVNGKETVNLSDYDLIFWVGYSSPVDALVRLMCNYAIDGVIRHEAKPRMSFALFREILMEFVTECLPDDVWLNAASRPKLIVHLCPIIAETCLTVPKYQRNWHIVADNAKIFRRILALMMKRMTTRLAEHNIDVLEQPPETLAQNGMTKVKYSVGSVRLLSDEAHPENDPTHMNSIYGRLLLQRLFANLGTTTQDAADRPVS